MRRDLTEPLIEYATALRMRKAPTPAQVDAAYASLVDLRSELGDDVVVERDLATLLAEFLLTAWSSIEQVPGDERQAVEQTLAVLSEAAMAALTPDDMPPHPGSG
jgi:hypothetical protein